MSPIAWRDPQGLPGRTYTCGYCGNTVGPDKGYFGRIPDTAAPVYLIYICPFCNRPTYFNNLDNAQIPGVAYGNEVSHLPEDVSALYQEARNCVAASSHTSAVLTCRKLLMNVAVAQGAPEGKSFIEYVGHLAGKGYVPPGGHGWVDHIRQKGNEANHEITLMSQADAEELISFVEMLLKFIYEFPAKIRKPGS